MTKPVSSGDADMPKSSKSTNSKTRKDKLPNAEAAASSNEEWVKITLRTDLGYAISFRSNCRLQEIAMKWRAVVRNRSLWTGNQEKREERARLASEDVKEALKLSQLKSPEIATLKETLKTGQEGSPEEIQKRIDEEIAKRIEADIEAAITELAKARIIEVSIPFVKEKLGWEARILPWEYLITAATGSKRSQPLTIIRHLDCDRASSERPPQSLLMIVSAPGKVRETSNFGAERDVVRAALGIKGDRSLNDSADEVSGKIHQQSPDIVHLAGVDTHQGVNLKLWFPPDRKATKKAPELMVDGEQNPAEKTKPSKAGLTDGFLMKAANEQIEAVSAEKLGEILNVGESGGQPKRPLLVSCNIYHSAARIGPMIVAGGAEAAIGFQDEFDEALAELFFGNFYHAWRASKWDLLAAFVMACQMLRAQPRGLSGTGVVLWTARSFLKSSVEKNEAFKLPELGDLELAMRQRKSRRHQTERRRIRQRRSRRAQVAAGGNRTQRDDQLFNVAQRTPAVQKIPDPQIARARSQPRRS
jgi:hypothetical protein